MVNFPKQLVAGETLEAKVTHATATSITVIFVGPEKKTPDFAKVGDVFTLSEVTDGWTAGKYAWQLWVETPGGKSVCGSGRIDIAASLADIEPGTDTRTTAEKNIEAIETMLAGKASSATKRYRINNRELESYGITELLQLLEYWKTERRKERGPRRPRHLRVHL